MINNEEQELLKIINDCIKIDDKLKEIEFKEKQGKIVSKDSSTLEEIIEITNQKLFTIYPLFEKYLDIADNIHTNEVYQTLNFQLLQTLFKIIIQNLSYNYCLLVKNWPTNKIKEEVNILEELLDNKKDITFYNLNGKNEFILAKILGLKTELELRK